MNDILKKIIDIENEAKEIMLEVELMERGAQDSISKDIEAIRAKLNAEVDGKIDKAKLGEDERYEALLKKQDDEHTKQIESLENQFSQNTNKWQDEVYQRIIADS